jgi:hypothetical protein
VQWWQVLLVFGGAPMLLFSGVWALVWFTTKPSAVPPGIAKPSGVPSGGSPPMASQGAEMPPAAPDPQPGHSHDASRDQGWPERDGT